MKAHMLLMLFLVVAAVSQGGQRYQINRSSINSAGGLRLLSRLLS